MHELTSGRTSSSSNARPISRWCWQIVALALAGMQSEAESLYRAEAHVKIGLARVELAAPGRRGQRDWAEPVGALRDAVLRHATEDEEAPALSRIAPASGRCRDCRLSNGYAREFSRVIPVPSR